MVLEDDENRPNVAFALEENDKKERGPDKGGLMPDRDLSGQSLMLPVYTSANTGE
jgi:hypothetical protein